MTAVLRDSPLKIARDEESECRNQFIKGPENGEGLNLFLDTRTDLSERI